MSPAAAVFLAGLGGAAAAAGWLTVLPRLREPDNHEREPKTAYRSLATGRAAVVVAALAAAGVLLSALSLPTQVQPLWAVLAVFGVPLACVDALTTWLPASVTRCGWAAMVGAALLIVVLGGSWTEPARAVAGAAAAGGLFGLVWLISRGGFGFGDVRYVPLIGAATAAQSWELLFGALLLGSACAALHAVARRLLTGSQTHPWTPGLLVGCYGAVALFA